MVIGGNIINNGIITAAQLITFGGLGYIINTPQNISGSGIFRNNTTSPTANIASATLDNTGGLNIANASAIISISNTLNLTNGALNVGNNILKMNQGSVLNRTNGFVIGNINRWVNSGTNVNVVFPIGVGNTYTPFSVNFPSITSAGELVLNNTNTDHPQISSSCIDAAKSVNRYWSLFGIGFGPLVNYSVNINFASSEIDLGANAANFKLEYYNSTNWTTANLVSVSSSNISANGINGAGEFQIGEFISVNASITISASSTNICLGSNVVFTATPVNGGSSPIFQWRKNGNIVSSNSNTYNDNTLNNGDQITCSLTSSLPCGAGNPVSSNTINMQVSAPTVKGTVSPSQQICVGNSPTQLNLSGNNGSIIRWEFATAPFTTWNTINHISTTYQPGAITQTTAFRAIVQNGSCAVMASDSAIITVLSAPVGGTVNGSSTICSGTIAPTLTLTGHSGGNIIRWESSIFPFFVWNPISNTTTTLNPGVLSITTRFRAVISNGTCNPVFSNDAIINIQQPGTWLGLVSSDWTNPSNWCGGVPGTTTNVTITSGTPFAPVINGNVNCNDLVMNNNATLSFTGTTNTLNIHGDAFISNSAIFNTTNGTVNFASNNYQLIPAINFHHLTISGGGFKEIAGNILVNNILTLNNGLIQLNNSNITIGTNGSINGGSSASYIVTNNFGKLIQNNIGSGGKTGLTFYPVGSNTFSYTPIYILNSGTADNYGVGVIEGVYNSYSGETPNGMSILSNVVDKTFVINESVSGGSNLSILMQWNGANELSGFNRANCYASRYMLGGWNPFSATSASGSNPYSILVTGITNTGLFGIGSNGALPVSWISFFGNKKGHNIELKWQTASEKINKGFYVERSVNGNDFESIGFVDGKNNSNAVANYSFTDFKVNLLRISNPEIGKLFYRLKQVDIDGTENYSNTISIDLMQQTDNEEFYIYPNPFTDAITINTYQNENEKVDLSIADISGKILLNETLLLNNGTATLNNINTLPSGVYMINITINGNLYHKKLIKQ